MSIRTKYADFTLENAALLACDTGLAMALENTADLPEMEAALVKHLAKIGNKSESFAREAHALGKQHEGLLPRDMDLETLERALKNRDALRDRLIAAKHLVERLEAAVVLLGVDSYKDGLDIYHALKRGGTTQSLREQVKKLGRNFRKSPRKPKTTAAEAGGTKAPGKEVLKQTASTAKVDQAPGVTPATREDPRGSGDAFSASVPSGKNRSDERRARPNILAAAAAVRRSVLTVSPWHRAAAFTTGQECPVPAQTRTSGDTMRQRSTPSPRCSQGRFEADWQKC